MTRVHMCNYGIGNIYNVERALRHAGAEVVSCTEPDQLQGVEALVIPGVGAFRNCITEFRKKGFEVPVRNLVEQGVPLLGICVGMQMLASGSEEYGESEGLGIIPGRVRKISKVNVDGNPLKLPHVAWSKLHKPSSGWDGSPLEQLADGTYAYFVHSYAFECDDDADILATVLYGGHKLTAAVQRGRVYGTQFHPEKSADAGLGLLRKFIEQASAL